MHLEFGKSIHCQLTESWHPNDFSSSFGYLYLYLGQLLTLVKIQQPPFWTDKQRH